MRRKWTLTWLYVEHALFDETSSITKPYTEFMNEDEVSDLLNEDMETLQDFQPGDDSTQADAHTQQTVQVVIYKAERSKKRPFTPSFERNQRPGSVKKRVNGASEFAIHEDQPGNGSSVKVSLTFERIVCRLHIDDTLTLDISTETNCSPSKFCGIGHPQRES